MKKVYFIKRILLIFIALHFISCENEPLTGKFPQEEQNEAEEGQFRAMIEGKEFIAASTSATLTSDNELVIIGNKPGGEKIVLAITNAAEGIFNLTTGGDNENSGIYFDGSINVSPYISAGLFGGSGQLNLTKLDITDKTLTGTFSFTGVRIKVDGDGNPILDGDGNPVMEDIEITKGAFNSIAYVLDDSGGGGTGGDPQNKFFAKVDGVDFIADTLRVTEPVVGNVHMIKIEARSSKNELIRIDIPRALGVGTFQMVKISDGTKLIASYNANQGGENLTSNPGSITITEFDLEEGVLKATFEFTGKDPLGNDPTVVQVTEGDLTAHFEGIPGANNMFRANVDGADFSPETLEVLSEVVNQYPRVTLIATVGKQKMELSFPETITEGTFEMAKVVTVGNEVVGVYTPIVGTSISYVSSPGSIVITNYDIPNGIIEGTFNFTGVDATGQDPKVYQITAGEFLAVLK
ncbi:MAG: DUF6252 family protein [Aequorivita sp.]